MQLNLDISGFDPGKLETGCDGLRVQIFAKVHSIGKMARLCENYGVIGEEKAQFRYEPWLEDLVWGLVGMTL